MSTDDRVVAPAVLEIDTEPCPGSQGEAAVARIIEQSEELGVPSVHLRHRNPGRETPRLCLGRCQSQHCRGCIGRQRTDNEASRDSEPNVIDMSCKLRSACKKRVCQASQRCAYNRRRRSRSAFVTTVTELSEMARTAIIGESSTPNSGYRMPAAMGTPSAL